MLLSVQVAEILESKVLTFHLVELVAEREQEKRQVEPKVSSHRIRLSSLVQGDQFLRSG